MTELICCIDVGTSKICALIAELDEDDKLRVIGAGRSSSQGLKRGVVVNAAQATQAIGQAVTEAERVAGQTLESAYVGIAGSHISAIANKGVVAVGRSGRSITREDMQRAIEQARNVALPQNREIILTVPRSFCVDQQQGIQNPVGMFGYRLEVDASIITGASTAVTNLVNCVQANGVAIEDLVLEPLASAEAVLTEDERQLGVVLVDIGGGTSDMAIYLENAPWHTADLPVSGEYFVHDVASGLRMPWGKAEALMQQFGYALPGAIPPDAEVRSGAFGQEGQQIINRRSLAEILNARAEEWLDQLLIEVKRSGYDGLLPAGVVLTGGIAQLAGFSDLSRERLSWPIRVGRPNGLASSVMDLSSPEYATSVGLLLWRLRQGSVQRVAPATPGSSSFDRIMRWLRTLLPSPT